MKRFRTGYPNLATFVDSDDSFGLYRRFGYLQARTLLEKQDELRCLEQELDTLDEAEQDKQPDKLFRRKLQGAERKALLDRIELSFIEYCTSWRMHFTFTSRAVTDSPQPTF